MTITFEIAPDAALRLQEQASRCGQTAEQFLQNLVLDTVSLPPQTLPDEEWLALLTKVPAAARIALEVPSECLRREAIYGDRA